MKDIKAKILSNKEIARGYFKMTLDAPYIAQNAKPGQFVQVRCSDILDPLLRRPFSIHRVKEIELLYEVIGKGTDVLSQKKVGESIDVLGPLGNGFTLPLSVPRLRSGQTKRYTLCAILIAGGIGVAPLVFLAEELIKKKIKPVVLIGAKTEKVILCEKDFKNLGAKVEIATDDGSKGYKGLVSDLFKKLLVTGYGLRVTKVYACGPNPMLRRVADMCEDEGLECEVSLEEEMACGIGACLGCAVKVRDGSYKLACKDGPVFNAKKLSW